MNLVAIDPGKKGALVYERERKLEQVISWRPCSVGYKINSLSSGRVSSRKVPNLSGVFSAFRRPEVYACVCEQIRLFPGKKGVITLAESTAEVYAPFKATAYNFLRVSSSEWRMTILGKSERIGRDALDSAAIKYAQETRPELTEIDSHIADAICMLDWLRAEVDKCAAV